MIQFNPLTIFGPQVMAQTSVTNGELAQASSSSSFIGQGTPGDHLNGTLSGLTVAAAIAGPLGSPTLARICSHPLFAGAALMLGASHQAQAWSHTGGLLSSALLFLSSVATAVSGYSFLRGFKAGWQALKSSTRLAVFDRVRTLQDEMEERLNKAVERSGNPILAEARALASETHADVKSAVEHFKDLRDEKPQRIAAAQFSGLMGNPKIESVIAWQVTRAGREPAVEACLESLGGIDVAGFAALDDEAFRSLKKSAYQAMGAIFKAEIAGGAPEAEVKAAFREMAESVRDSLDAARADALVVAANEIHLTVRRRVEEARADAEGAAEKAALGSRLVPAMLSRLSGKLDPETAKEVREVLKSAREIERLLATTVKENGVLSRWFALPPADPRGYVRKTVLHATESQRVASASPRNWVTEAIGDPTYSPLQKQVGRLLGENINPGLMYAIPALATLQMIAGGCGALGWFLSLAPAAAVYLYNARQGRKRFNVSPAPSQDLTLERYGDETLQKRTLERLERAVPPMENGERERFVADVRKTLDKVEADIAALEALTVPAPGKAPLPPEMQAAANDASWRRETSRKFTPIPTPDPNRPYAYDHRPG
ncbi:MAG TPA: hypothetical protein VFX30_06390, partial [bacterium]|nr:hypothetical protein [bacterium]